MTRPRKIPTFLLVALLLLATLATAQPTTETDTPPVTPDTSPSYGVDCSFPMHTLDFHESRCGDLLGDRFQVYQDFMEGCRAQFGKRCDITEDSRVDQMLRQVPSLRNYTSTGFAKTRAPPELFDLIQQHWQRNTQPQKNAAASAAATLSDLTVLDNPQHIEAWTKGHTYVNYWAHNTTYWGLADSKTMGGSLALQDRLFALAKPVLEDWTQMELRPTSLYGIRVYREGAILSPHVDRNPLISSAIINVAQDPAMTDDWPLEVIDREGKAVNISMVRGDMVLYESGTLIHGVRFVCQGCFASLRPSLLRRMGSHCLSFA